MIETKPTSIPKDTAGQDPGEQEVDRFRRALGPFVVAAEVTRMAMIFTDATQTSDPIIFANDSFLALTGFDYVEVVGKSFNFLMSRFADSESVARIEGQFREENTETIEVECRRKDGRPCLLAIRINPVNDKDGRVVQHCISFVDLSDHVERVRQERDALHALYQHTPDFIATTQGAGHYFTFANDAYQRLVGNRGILGLTVAEAIPELVAQGFIALLDKVFATGRSFTGKSMAVTLHRDAGADGETRFIDFICQAIRNPDGGITGIFCEGHDVTEQKLAADKLRQLQAEVIHLARVSAMGTIAATLAHELSQPLTSISNHAEVCCVLADGEAATDPRLVNSVHAVRSSATRAREIIRRLRDMTKRSTPERSLFDLNDLIGETIELLRIGVCAGALIEDKSISRVHLEADRVQIQQVIVNLVKNGCEAASGRPDRRVAISTRVSGDFAFISVSDNGTGVPPDAVPTLFDWSDSTKAEGMGIGLSICRTIIDAHCGTIWLESSDSEGSCFCISLPRHPAAPSRWESAPA